MLIHKNSRDQNKYKLLIKTCKIINNYLKDFKKKELRIKRNYFIIIEYRK